MNHYGGPASPHSAGSNDSYGRGYGGPNMNGGSQGGFMGAPSDVPYHGGPYGAARPAQASPPSSGHPSSATDASRGASSAGRPPSSASSIGGRSDARGMGMPHGNHRDSTRSNFRPDHEDTLQKHYFALRGYLAAHLRDEKGNIKPNRARDKLLRLSVTQFMELSTDVYDELVRREDERSQRVPNVPRFLPPKQSFHPKRNQARQKLSTLPVERFRQLATDVFFELERRVPRFAGNDIDRPMSGQSRGMRPPNGYRGPPNGPGRLPNTPSPYGYGPSNPPSRSYSPGPNAYAGARSRQPSDASSLGRPFPKNFHGGTVVPNKSTMVEDDDDDEDGLSGRYSGNEQDKEAIRNLEGEVEELKKQVATMQTQLLEKNNELARMRDSDEQREHGLSTERGQWHELREDLEQKVVDAERLNQKMRDELEMLKRSKVMDEQHLRDQIDGSSRELHMLRGHHEDLQNQYSQLEMNGNRGAGSEEQEHRISMLEAELANQRKIANEVREDATANLREMRELSRQNDQAVEQEEKLAAQVALLERQNEDWRQRYAKIKAQNKSLRASTMGLNLSNAFDAGSLMRKEGLTSKNGLVKDVDVTRFQLAVDDLLKSARKTSTDNMIDSVKQVTIAVQSISSDIGTDGYPTPSQSPHTPHSSPDVSKLKARVTGTANSLITATKQHASSHGLSPVALLDAAASNLTASVVELIKAVGIRPSSGDEHRDADLDSFYGDGGSEDYDRASMPSSLQHAVAGKSGMRAQEVSHGDPHKPAGWFNWGRDDGGMSNGHGQAHGHGHTASDDYDHYA